MNFWSWLTRRREDHGWPGYIINGRIRTSTVALIVAFFVISWVHSTYQPPPPPPAPAAAVVPPGFLPDPEYTWVPRTNVEQPRTTTATTTTTETTPTETTSPTETTGPAPTTLVDPDGPGPLPPTPVTSTTTPTSPILPVPNRSGTPTTTPTTTAIPGPGTLPATPPPPG